MFISNVYPQISRCHIYRHFYLNLIYQIELLKILSTVNGPNSAPVPSPKHEPKQEGSPSLVPPGPSALSGLPPPKLEGGYPGHLPQMSPGTLAKVEAAAGASYR